MNRRHVISEVMTRGFQGRNLTAYILYAIREQRLLGELINRSVCLCILMYAIVVAIFVHTATAQITPDLLKSVDLIARLCLAEDQKSDAGDRSEDALKRLSIKEQELIAQGLLNQIDNTISKVPANERDKVRDCLKPVRERLIEILLRSSKRQCSPQSRPPSCAWAMGEANLVAVLAEELSISRALSIGRLVVAEKLHVQR